MSATKSVSAMVAMKARRSAAARSGGMRGSAAIERPISGLDADQPEDAAGFVVGGELDDRGIVGQVGDAPRAVGIEHADLPVGQPVRLAGLDRFPGHGADGVDLAALHRQRLLRRALESADDLESGADQVVQRQSE